MKLKLTGKERAIVTTLLNTSPSPAHNPPTENQRRYKGYSLSEDTTITGEGWLPVSVIILRAEGLERTETNFAKWRDSLVNKGVLEQESFSYSEKKKKRQHKINCYRLRRDKEGFTALYDAILEDVELSREFHPSEYVRAMMKQPYFAELFLSIQKRQLGFIEKKIEDNDRDIIKLMRIKDGFLSVRKGLNVMMERTKAKQRK